MQLTITLDKDDNRSLQVQIFEQIRYMILDGRLKSSDPIPGSREMSELLAVSRNTVVLAYERLMAEGYIETNPSVGTFINSRIPEAGTAARHQENSVAEIAENKRIPQEHGVVFDGPVQQMINPHRDQIDIDFWAGRPDAKSFPLKPWRRIINRKLLQAGSSLTDYHDPQGDFTFRQAIADHLGPARGIKVTPDQVIIVGGIQDGLSILACLLVEAGSSVVLENPCYQGAYCAFEARRAKIHAVDTDEYGLKVDSLPDVGQALAYVTPSHQYPTGGTLSLERRISLLNWALETRSYIVEDDYDSDFRYSGSPLTALKGLDTHGSVIYLGTFTKCMGAALRLGYMVVPKELVRPAGKLKALTSSGQPWLEQVAMAEFIEGGSFTSHLRRIRQTYLTRRDHLVKELRARFGNVVLSGLNGGMHCVWKLPSDWPPAHEVCARALEERVGFYCANNGAACTPGSDTTAERCLILGYCSLSEADISEGISRLAKVLPKTRMLSSDSRSWPASQSIFSASGGGV